MGWTPSVALVFWFASAATAAPASRLSVRDPVSLGHVQRHGKRQLELRTVSVDPPVFLAPGLLSASEADELIALAKAQKRRWEKSDVVVPSPEDMPEEEVEQFDADGDGMLDFQEMQELSLSFFNMPNYDASAHKAMIAHVAARLGPHEAHPDAHDLSLRHVLRADLFEFFSELGRREPHRMTRYSDQVWLGHGSGVPLLKEVLDRAQELTGFPEEVMKFTERMQVVHYRPRGHYSCHHDSSPDSIDEGDVRLATLGIFLNEPERGGETVFPGALRNDTGDWGEAEWGQLEGQCQQTSQCTAMGGLQVQPRKGDAVFWYNVRPEVFPDLAAGKPVSGPDALIWGSVHCAAEVLEGEKWFANLWMRLPPPGESIQAGGDEL